jgi:predicted helicase
MAFVPDGQGNLRKTFGPEDVFHYLYALLHSPAYRRRYAQSLKADFPRVPLTSRPALFRALCPLGEKLTALHLLKADVQLITQFRIPGSDRVEDVFYSNGCVWVNKTQCFEMVPTEVWEFCIGGYQVCCKWLKDRKGRTLTFDEITHYQRIVAALAATVRLMADIDRTVARNGGWPIQ